ncbi:MAG: hypothetical protein KDA45_00120 [Planctomycetales bacterium]|nr:hypothetical protein [Planctomycetales bacterium]
MSHVCWTLGLPQPNEEIFLESELMVYKCVDGLDPCGWLASLGLVSLVTLVGCGPETRSPIVPVTGTISFANGTKLPAGTMVVFSPVLGGAGSAMAETDNEGKFTVTHASGNSGAEVGDYLIELRSPKGLEQEFYRSVPSTYTDGGGLAATVPSDGGEIELVLRKGRR